MIRRLALVVVLLLAALAAVVAWRTLRPAVRQLDVAPVARIAIDEQGAAESLATAVRARTISVESGTVSDDAAFEQLQAHLRARYPRLHAALGREVVGPHSLIYTWPGSDPSAKPIAVMAHQDVVPIAPGTEGDWQQPPFSGAIAGGYVWGRGTWDDKGNLIAEMEAIERLLADGFKPKRTIVLIAGHDEEVGGEFGAAKIAALLKSRGVHFDFVVDEGLLITDGVMPGLATPAALVGIAEKGFVSIRLAVHGQPGHSSMPPPGESTIAPLAAALVKLDAHPVPGGIDGVARMMFEAVAPQMSGFGRVALSNLWLFGPVVERQLSRGASTNAMLRSTTALTIVRAGDKENVLPGVADAIVNFRLLPGDSKERIVEFVKATIDDPRVQVSAMPGDAAPSRVSAVDSHGYRSVETTMRELFPNVIVAPGLMIGGTDSRHFDPIADTVIRFTPVWAKPDDLKRFHGTNERLGVANLADMIRFYHRLLSQAAG